MHTIAQRLTVDPTGMGQKYYYGCCYTKLERQLNFTKNNIHEIIY